MKWRNGWQQWEVFPGVVLDVFHWSASRDTSKNVLVTAGIHGDEYEGPAAVIDLASEFDPAKLMAGGVTLIPVANPPAYLAGTRTNPDGLNLARCFPGEPKGMATERLAAALFEGFVSQITHLIDLHSGGVAYTFLPVAGFYGSASTENPSFAAARAFGLPRLWRLPETDGVLSCEFRKRGAVSFGSEYLGAGQLSEDGATAYRRGVMRCLIEWGLHEGQRAALPPQLVLSGDWQLSSKQGLFRKNVLLGEQVRAGCFLAKTVSPNGSVLEEFHAPTNGVIGAIRNKAFISEGDWAILLFEELDAG